MLWHILPYLIDQEKSNHLPLKSATVNFRSHTNFEVMINA